MIHEEKTNIELKNITELEKMLNIEISINNKCSWNKLDRSVKLMKLKLYCDNYSCDNDEKKQLLSVLKEALKQNKLQKIKDVHYDVDNESIISVPALKFIEGDFIIKNEKRISTTKSLPTKNKLNNITMKKKQKIDNNNKE